MPEFAVEVGGADLLLEDCVGVAEDVEAFLGDLLADDPDAQAGAGERLAPDEAFGESEFEADGAYLSLKSFAERLDEFELEVVGETADVVVALDGVRAGPPPDSMTSE